MLGYLLAGAFIGPYGAGKFFGYSLYDPEELRHVAELGVAMFLFLIGLELRPKRLWKMRAAVFGASSVQLFISGVALVALIYWLDPHSGYSFPQALLIGLALALSSTAFALQILEEKGELTARHGPLAFSILLFQDLAAIPLIAIVPLVATNVGTSPVITFAGALKMLAAVGLILVVGQFVLDRLYRLLASTQVREAMTAAALLTVAAVSLLITEIGLSASLGAFLAGVLLADSSFRHQLEADIEPFEMLLLALFFTSIGMGLNYEALFHQPGVIAAGVGGVVAVKAAILYAIGRWQRLGRGASVRFAIVTSQCGEFAFVVFASAQQGGILTPEDASTLGIIVTLSMATTPILLSLDGFIRKRLPAREPAYDKLPTKDNHVVIAGFGRVGQVVARILTAKGIPFTALDDDPDQVHLVNQFGNKSFFGDVSRLTILEAAETSKARAFVLAIDDVDKSLKTAQLLRTYFPQVPIYARARNRRHVHQLMDLGVEISNARLSCHRLSSHGMFCADWACPKGKSVSRSTPSKSMTKDASIKITPTIPMCRSLPLVRCSVRRNWRRSSLRIGRQHLPRKPNAKKRRGRRMGSPGWPFPRSHLPCLPRRMLYARQVKPPLALFLDW
ncbi:MAG: cation:proton antiporter [Rhodomicrobium sp.]